MFEGKDYCRPDLPVASCARERVNGTSRDIEDWMSVASVDGSSDKKNGVAGRRSVLPEGLFLLDDEQRSVMPRWGRFFVSAGSSLYSQTEAGYRYTIAIAAPIRTYASAFAALGVVAAGSGVPSGPANPGEYIEFLRSLPVHSAVSVRSGNRRLKSLFLGSRTDRSMELFGVQVENGSSGGLSRWLPAAQAMSIEVAGTPVKKLPKRQRGQLVASRSEIVRENEFASLALGLDDVYSFVTYSRLECTIVGVVSRLNEEITGTTLSVMASANGTFVDGSLQHLLRVCEFSRTGQAFRSRVVSSGKQGEEPDHANAPAVVVFDGATSFLKWRQDWAGSHRIVVLDRTERHFDEAVATLNQEYIQNRADDHMLKLVEQAPRGVESVSFRERSR